MNIVFAADLHIRQSAPRKRIDDYLRAQWSKVSQILDLCQEKSAPLIVAGDFFHSDAPRHWLVRNVLYILNFEYPEVRVYSIAGQHDLPGNNASNWEDSPLGVLSAARRVHGSETARAHFQKIGIDFVDYGEDFPKNSSSSILVCHRLVTAEKTDMKGASLARSFIQKNRGYELIVVGDNHESFEKKIGKTTLISPGSLMRMRIDQRDHKPSVVCYNTKTKEYKRIFLKIAPSESVFVSKEEEEKEKQKKEKFAAYIDQIKKGRGGKISFERNLEAHITTNKIEKPIANKIWQAVEQAEL